MKGVARAVVGYSGGDKLNPNYGMMMDHTEAVMVEFDPKVVTYEDILIEWSRMDYPYARQKTQYKSAVWFTNEEQQEAIEEVVEGIKASAKGKKVFVDIEPVTRFYRGEEYHQNYLERTRRF
jgi:methionine-S-sulfoxide reductase